MEKTEKSVIKARAEIPYREWVEISLTLHGGKIDDVRWNVQGGAQLIRATKNLAESLQGQNVEGFKFVLSEKSTSEVLLKEVMDKLTGNFVPYTDEEICHCRKINRSVIDQMIVLGAHTPEKVRAWSTASSGCGTCRPEVEKLIKLRAG